MPARHPIALPAALLLSTASLACTVVAACAFLLVALVLVGGHEAVVLDDGGRAAWCAAAGCACATVAALIGLTRASGGLRPAALGAAWAFAFAWPLWGAPAAAAATVATGFAVHWGAGGERRARFDMPLAAVLAALALVLLGEAFAGAPATTDLPAGDLEPRAARMNGSGANEARADGARADGTGTEAGSTDEPRTDRTGSEAGDKDEPRTDGSGGEAGSKDEPSTDGSGGEAGDKDEPRTDATGGEAGSKDEPPTDGTGTDAGSTEEPRTDGATGDEAAEGTVTETTEGARADGGAGVSRGPSARPAAETLVRSYYRALDRRDFDAAWSVLSPGVRTSFGGYERWRAGFANTLSSRPTAIRVSGAAVELTLIARDRADCGVLEQRFKVRWLLEGGIATAISAAAAGAPTCSPT